ncbi:hypothetical protein FA13DRAFT_779416 [Coprinellus micaceus]|uniref:Uncharacterized protein n=1 Tax=Coprinellus micaceus TaxID=71717 RepID=A0A4Y7T3J4_COPMI|nr:hypothetical protein FA13DRAFT_779416 [Coprinellus micaceus]
MVGYIQLTDSQDRPPILFPRLHRLFLSSIDPLSLYIASNSMPTLKFINLDLPKEPPNSRENGEAMTAGLSRKTVALTDLRLASPVNGTIIERISQIETLKCLRITIPLTPPKDWGTLRLNLLTQLPALRALHIDQETDPDDDNEGSHVPQI